MSCLGVPDAVLMELGSDLDCCRKALEELSRPLGADQCQAIAESSQACLNVAFDGLSKQTLLVSEVGVQNRL